MVDDRDGPFGWRRLAAQAGLVLAAALMLALAGGLLLAAAWFWIAAHSGPVLASVALAAGCEGAGLVLLGLARVRARRAPPPPPPQSDRDAAIRAFLAEIGLRVPERGERPALIEAFLLGLTAGLRTRRGRGRDR